MDRLPDLLVDKIKKTSGIILTAPLKQTILEFVDRRMQELNMTIESYCAHLDLNPAELEQLINISTVNETYFFREESQFDFLHKVYLPSRSYKPLKIWCGACSTGEEPLSIYAMTKQFGIKTDITATDINTEALNTFRKGIYSKNSFRCDGQKFHAMIHSISKINGDSIQIHQEDIKKIHISYLNLQRTSSFPFELNCFDIILLRNIFIYFSEETTLRTLTQLWTVLKPDGILMLSSNEIASIPNNDYFEKKNNGSVYYLQKKPSKIQQFLEKNKGMKGIPAEPRKIEIHHAEMVPLKDADNEAESEEMKKVYREIIKFIDRKNFRKAQQLISEINFQPNELEYRYFLLGLIEHNKSQHKVAEENFYKSASLNPNFWPATTMLAFTYKHLDRLERSRDYFEQSLNILLEYVKNEKTCYNFIVDFAPAYIINLCRKNIDEIQKLIGE
ncbi:CheR family methyltransferase [Treponema sp.]|uniref:CheR family methyltransferase n=1 Tax=Treponema sp. TaxID=166 RepID=UPI00388FBBF4